MFAFGLSMLLAVNTLGSPAASCAASDIYPTVLSDPGPAPLVEDSGEHGTAQMVVTLDERGTATNVSLYHSSGDVFLDQAALTETRHTKFAPELEDCSAVSGRYLYTIAY